MTKKKRDFSSMRRRIATTTWLPRLRDFALEGPSTVRTVTVVTRHPGEVGDAIAHRFHRGVTTWQAQGVYSGQEKSVLFCTISRSEVEALRQLVLEVDPSIFLVVGQAHQARGGVLRDRLAH